MEQNNLDKKTNLRDRFFSFFIKNKIKIISFVLLILISLFIYFSLNKITKKNNNLQAEKYIKAGILLANNEKDLAKNYYEEIILSENRFYSILSLNALIEKNLIKDKQKVLEYFSKLENLKYSKELSELILFKKALYFIKIQEKSKGEKILKNLIDKNSNLKFAAEEIIN